MTVPFMRAYTELLVQTCHRRGAHAIGGMAAFIPNRRDPEVTERALAKVRDDKERESRDGFDGTWVAHPDLVPVATEIFDRVLGDRPNQKDRLRDGGRVERGATCWTSRSPGGAVTEAGIRANVRVALAYLDSWLRGTGAAAIDNLMEDAATAEIARSQLWLWRTRGVLSVGALRGRSATRSWRGSVASARAGSRMPGTPRSPRPRRRVRRVPDPARLRDARLARLPRRTGGVRPEHDAAPVRRLVRAPRAAAARPGHASTPSAMARFMPQTSDRCSSTRASNGQLPRTMESCSPMRGS